MNRRDFIKTTAMVGAGVALYGLGGAENAHGFYQGSGLGLTLFSQPLRGVGPGGIPVAVSNGVSLVTGGHPLLAQYQPIPGHATPEPGQDYAVGLHRR